MKYKVGQLVKVSNEVCKIVNVQDKHVVADYIIEFVYGWKLTPERLEQYKKDNLNTENLEIGKCYYFVSEEALKDIEEPEESNNEVFSDVLVQPKENPKAIFYAYNQTEINILSKAQNMALFIQELVNNGWREFKHSNYDYEKAWGVINKLLVEHNINPEEFYS